jgi:hypothetical protein
MAAATSSKIFMMMTKTASDQAKSRLQTVVEVIVGLTLFSAEKVKGSWMLYVYSEI